MPAVSSYLFRHGCDIVEHQQFDGPIRGRLFLRTAFVTAEETDADGLSAAFEQMATEFGMTFSRTDDRAVRALVMVSRMANCRGRPDLPVARRQLRGRPRRRRVRPRGPAPDGRGGRGVKLVGATAHYVTPDLEEGPIIEREVIRIDHTFDPRSPSTVGWDAEALALSRAVRWALRAPDPAQRPEHRGLPLSGPSALG